jgi:hypothetical protein
MSVINPTRSVALTTEYLNLPITAGITPTGYWFYYTPAVGGNTALGAKITPYVWGTKLPLKNGVTSLTMEGTMPLITETWDGSNQQYHGSCIEWIGPGVNDITGTAEDDAFFFSHLGAIAATDDAFYWDRAFEPVAGSDWEYYQYHAHLPTTYVQYENGRQTIGGDGWIDQGDKAYGYMISVRVRISSVNYTSVMARIHTPSVGGAHNSHNDVTLPTVGNKNYMPGGILRGVGERYHTFYISASGSDWEIFTRTYTDAAGSFGAETSLGVFNLADPLFNPSANQQSQYPVRAGMGVAFGARIYFPVILNNATSGFDLEIWSFNSLDTISGGTLTRQVLASGVATRPDASCCIVGTQAMYVLRTDPANGGCRLHKFDGTTWTDVGAFLTNNAADPIRVHGFEFNSQDFKFYSLLSGTASGGGSTYIGPGLYSFQLDDPFDGYAHLDYDVASASFIERGPLTAGYVQYEPSIARFTRVNATEPQAIGADITVLDYSPPGQSFFNRKSIGFGGKDFYYNAITLADGRKFASGQIEGNVDNLGIGGDFLFSLYSADLSQATHFAFGGAGDDYFTSVCQCKRGKRLWLTGYTKSQVIPKGEILIHGWCRNLNDGGTPSQWSDITIDTDGNIYAVGTKEGQFTVVAKYDKNYDLQWQRLLGDATYIDLGEAIAVDSVGNVYISGSTTYAGAGSTDVLLVKLDTDGTLQYAKVYGTASAENGRSIAVINKSGTEYIVIAVVSGTSTTFVTADLSGTIIEQNIYTNLVVNRVRSVQSTATVGRFLFAGNDGAGTNKAKFGMCELLSSTGKMMQWVSTYSSASAYTAYDIANTEAAVSGNNAGFAVCGTAGSTGGFLLKLSVNESAGTFTVSKSWAKTMVLSDGMPMAATPGLLSLAVSPYTDTTKYIWAVGCTNVGLNPAMGMEEGLVTRWQSTDGTLDWQNQFGHDMAETFLAVVNDTTGKNIVVGGWSESHSDSRDCVIFRCYKEGYGTGIYNLTTTGTAPYYYVISDLAVSSNTDTLTPLSAPSNTAASFATASYSIFDEPGQFNSRNYDGPFGPDGIFNLIIAYIDLDLLAAYMNTAEFRESNAKCNALNYINDFSQIGKIWQAGTVGDGSADDGNMFGYDIIEASSDLVYTIGQTSGDVAKTNTGVSGVYDYLLVELDPLTEEIEFYQNGTSKDEETYALTELANGKIAFTGRTSGELGDPNEGAYDIFLGIYNPVDETFVYRSIGSGLDDVGANIHDLGNNELAIAYFSYGSLVGTTNSGSQDIGVVKYNYATNTWGTAYQTGSSTSELFLQNGRPSTLLTNNRIAITASSTGIFADNAITYGYLDICLAILDLTTGIWSKFQVGTTANEIAASISNDGDILLIAGNAGGSFTDDIDAVFVEFDASDGYVAKSSSVA